MARYYFHIEGHRPYRDEVGEDLTDDAAAWREAMLRTRELHEGSFEPGHSWHLEVIEQGMTVYRLTVATSRHR